MKNKIEAESTYEAMEDTSDVVDLLKMVKGFAYASNDKKYPALQTWRVLKSLLTIQQKEDEDLRDYYKSVLPCECRRRTLPGRCLLLEQSHGHFSGRTARPLDGGDKSTERNVSTRSAPIVSTRWPSSRARLPT